MTQNGIMIYRYPASVSCDIFHLHKQIVELLKNWSSTSNEE